MTASDEPYRLLLRAAGAEGGVFLALGKTDTGKTTLLRGLGRLSLARDRPVAFLDADMGQSTYGVPTTLNLALLEPEAGSTAAVRPRTVATYFVGSTSPVGHLLQTVVGCKRLLQEALAMGARTVLIDTTGLVEGPLAVEFKLQKVDLLAPTHIVALARGAELDPILAPFEARGRPAVVRLAVSRDARARSAAERRESRQLRYQAYFRESRSHRLALDRVAVWGSVPQAETEALSGLLLGLSDRDNWCRGLGVLKVLDVRRGIVEFSSPIPSLAEVRCIRFGSVRIGPAGEELGGGAARHGP